MSLTHRLVRSALLTVAFAFATFALGWSGVPLVAAIAGIIDRRASVPGDAAIAAAVAWAVLLGAAAARGEVLSVAAQVGGAAGLPPFVLPLLTVAFPAALAWSSAAAAGLIVGVARTARS